MNNRNILQRRVIAAAWMVAVLVVLCAGGLAGAEQSAIQVKLDKLLRHKDVYPWKLSVLAVDLDSGRRIFASRESRPLVPASNMKLVVTAAALSRWGSEYEFETVLARRGRDLVLIGSGDPGLGDAALQIKYGQDPTSVFRDWARKLKEAGVTEVGDIIVDDMIFDRQFVHPDWPKDQLNRTYTPMVGGLNLWENMVRVRKYNRDSDGKLGALAEPAISYRPKNKQVAAKYRQVDVGGGEGMGKNETGGVNIHLGMADPGIFFGSVFKAVLAKEGVAVCGDVRRERVVNDRRQLDEQVQIVAKSSTKLRDIIGRANKLSRALFVECLIKALGANQGEQGSWESGAKAVGEFLTEEVGVFPEQFVIADGSGLSQDNRLSPEVLVSVLEYMARRGDIEVFRESLSISGRDGTLRKRLKNSALRGRVFAKTGYIDGARSLSGYLRSKRGKWIAFSILMNKVPNGHGGRVRQLQRDICELLVNY